MYYQGEDQAYGEFDNLGAAYIRPEAFKMRGPKGKRIPWELTASGGPNIYPRKWSVMDPSLNRNGHGGVVTMEVPKKKYYTTTTPMPRRDIAFSGNLNETQARAFGQERSRLAREKRGPWAPRAGMTVATGQALTGFNKSRFTEGPAKRIRQETENDIGPRRKAKGLRGIWNALTRGRGRKIGLIAAQTQRIEDDGVSTPGAALRYGLPKLYKKPRRDYMDDEVPGIVRPLGPGRGMMDERADKFAVEVQRKPGVRMRLPFKGGLIGWLRDLFKGRGLARGRQESPSIKPLGPVDNLYGWEFEPGSAAFTRWPSEPETFTTEYEGSYSNN
jgi:hypothetical protein